MSPQPAIKDGTYIQAFVKNKPKSNEIHFGEDVHEAVVESVWACRLVCDESNEDGHYSFMDYLLR